MLSDGQQSNYFPQVDGYNSLLIEIEKYEGEALVEDCDRGPFLAAGIRRRGNARLHGAPKCMYERTRRLKP